MIFPRNSPPIGGKPAFSLIEMVTVVVVVTILLTAGVSLLSGTGSQARKAGTDLVTGMIEQARTTAITSRCHVVLAVAEPGDLPAGDERCRIGLFKVSEWESSTEPLKGVLMSRWHTLETGIALIGGNVDGVENPCDAPELTIEFGGAKQLAVTVHAIAFNSRGGLHYPAGSTPVALRIAEGTYRSGKPVAYRRGDAGTVTENRLKIGRVIARPYRIDG